MRTEPTLIIDGKTHSKLEKHLLLPDKKEAIAILLCARVVNEFPKLLVRDVIFIPHHKCLREGDHITWPGSYLEDAIDKAEQERLSVILLHSHPGGYFDFSDIDDRSDKAVIPSVFMALPDDVLNGGLHGSAIMVPGGAIKARLYNYKYDVIDVRLVAVYGDDIELYWNHLEQHSTRPMAFSKGMTSELSNLSATVVGVSGTGSIVAEQLARIGVGHINVVDFDRVEIKNLNRILNSTLNDAYDEKLKVDVFKEAVQSFSSTTHVITTPHSINSRVAIESAAQTDLLFCCVDSQIGRNICDLISSAFLMPLFDIGVVIPIRKQSNGKEAILDINIRLDYVQPSGSSLLDRNVYSPEGISAEELTQTDPELYKERVREGYMPGSIEEAPAVISANMNAASLCVQEFIARTYPYRLDPNSKFARTLVSLAENETEFLSEYSFQNQGSDISAKAFDKPLLGIPSLEDEQ